MRKITFLIIFIILFSLSVDATNSDFDGNGCVEFNDFTQFINGYGDYGGNNKYNEKYDLNKDNQISVDDFFIFSNDWGKCKKYIIYDSSHGYVTDEIKRGVIKKFSVDGSKYLFYIAANPNFDFKVQIVDIKLDKTSSIKSWSVNKIIKEIEPSFISESKEFFDEKLDKSMKIYTVLLDIDELDEGDYSLLIPDPVYYNGRANIFFFSIRKADEIIKTNTCSQISKSKYSKAESINLAFVGDMYSESEMNLYTYDVDAAFNVFLNDPTIAPYKDRINAYRTNYVGDLECRFASGCIPFANKITSLGLALFTVPDNTFCCNSVKSNSIVENSCGKGNYIVNVLSNEEEYGGAVIIVRELSKLDESPLKRLVTVAPLFIFGGDPITLIPLFVTDFANFFREYVLGKDEAGITAQTRQSQAIFSHEIGHLVASLPDYYLNDPSCERYDCKMCNEYASYSDKGLCYDKQWMVAWLNQWCKAEVEAFKDKDIFKKHNSFWKITRISPYPNPFNPAKNQTTAVEFNIKYEEGEDPCYVLMNVYNPQGQLIDMVVSENVLPNGNHKLVWDGRDMLTQQIVASGVYLYEIHVGDSKDTVKGTVLK